MKVFICPGRLFWSDFLEIVEKSESIEIVGVLANNKSYGTEWNPEKTKLRTWIKEELVNVDKNLKKGHYHERYDEVLDAFLQDIRSTFLLERIYTQGLFSGYDSAFNQSVMLEIAVWNSIAILSETDPDRVIVPETPHSVTWILVKTAELLGIDVYITPESPLKWKRWVVKGLEDQTPVELSSDHYDNRTPDKVEEYISSLRSSYDDAIPEYERIPLEKFKKKEGSLTGEIRTILSQSSPRAMISKSRSALEKREALDLYKKIAGDFQYPERYIVYFLHFQPERTTLPEGRKYVQQWLAIRALSMSLPEDTRLVVKEHPSTFRNHFSKKVRSPHFYKSLNSLPNVLIAPLSVTPFELIDKSAGIATCTGTVGIEAVVRGKPVLVLGTAQYRGLKNVFEANNYPEISSAVLQILNGIESISDQELMNYFSFVDKNSFEIKNLEKFTVEGNDMDFSVDAIVEALKVN